LELESDSSKVDWEFELLKDFSKLLKEISPEKPLNTLKNLMYHKYFLNNPRKFAIFVLNNLPDIDEMKRNSLIKNQQEISENWKARQM
jgi:hypothetical protein